LQVSLFCLAIGQDPKNLPVAIVNAENNGAHCFLPPAIDDNTYQCPITFSEYLGLPEPNKKHLVNFTCRYMSFVGKIILLFNDKDKGGMGFNAFIFLIKIKIQKRSWGMFRICQFSLI
jgi:hypothetical protein